MTKHFFTNPLLLTWKLEVGLLVYLVLAPFLAVLLQLILVQNMAGGRLWWWWPFQIVSDGSWLLLLKICLWCLLVDFCPASQLQDTQHPFRYHSFNFIALKRVKYTLDIYFLQEKRKIFTATFKKYSRNLSKQKVCLTQDFLGTHATIRLPIEGRDKKH